MRQKQVFPRAEVAHLWANQRQDSARDSSGSFYFNGPTIYSSGPHFPMASIHEKEGTRYAIITTRTYSNTTAKHQSIVRGACSHLDRVWCAYPSDAINGNHEANIKAFEKEAKGYAEDITPRTRKPEKYLNLIYQVRETFKKYCAHFDLNEQELREKYSLRYLYIESRDGSEEATREEREARERERIEEEARRKEQARKDRKKDLATLRKWRALDPSVGLVLYFNVLDETYLRINIKTQEIETSKGIKMKFDVAERFYSWYYKTLKGGGCTGDCEKEMLGYSVRTANENGLTVGCHNISIDEITTLAKAMKWTVPQVAIERCKLVKAGKAISLN